MLWPPHSIENWPVTHAWRRFKNWAKCLVTQSIPRLFGTENAKSRFAEVSVQTPFPPTSFWQLASSKPLVDKPVPGPSPLAKPTVYSHALIWSISWWLILLECKMALMRTSNYFIRWSYLAGSGLIYSFICCSCCDSRSSLKLIIYY